MRYGIVSDIHGNLEALDAVLARLAASGASAYLSLGDVVGYGADPNACCERVAGLPGLRVAGNHDRAATGGFQLTWFNPDARAALEWTVRQLSARNRAFLAALPDREWGDGFELAHGSPAEPITGYVTEEWEAIQALDEQVERMCFIGHTHAPVAFVRRAGSRFCRALELRSGRPLVLEPDLRYLVNCGSVGQPRDGDPRAACGLYDTETGTIECLRVPYDVASAQAKMRAAGLPARLTSRLAEGF